MKLKKIVIFLIIILLIFIIYILNIDKKVYYVNITDSNNKYNLDIKNNLKKINKLEMYIDYVDLDYRITDLVNDINNNKEISINGKKYTIQNSLIKADLLTLKIGSNEIKYKINNKDLEGLYNYMDEYLNDLEKLFKLIRKYDKEKIVYINSVDYNSSYISEVIKYLNLKIKDLCSDYDIKYIEINNKNNINIKEKVLKYLHLTI